MTRKTSHFCKCASGTMNVRGREEGGGGGGEREGTRYREEQATRALPTPTEKHIAKTQISINSG